METVELEVKNIKEQLYKIRLEKEKSEPDIDGFLDFLNLLNQSLDEASNKLAMMIDKQSNYHIVSLQLKQSLEELLYLYTNFWDTLIRVRKFLNKKSVKNFKMELSNLKELVTDMKMLENPIFKEKEFVELVKSLKK